MFVCLGFSLYPMIWKIQTKTFCETKIITFARCRFWNILINHIFLFRQGAPRQLILATTFSCFHNKNNLYINLYHSHHSPFTILHSGISLAVEMLEQIWNVAGGLYLLAMHLTSPPLWIVIYVQNDENFNEFMTENNKI